MVVVSHFSLSKRKRIVLEYQAKPNNHELKKSIGQAHKALITAKIAEKTAERAFSLASSANVGVGVLSRALATRPKWISRDQTIRDEVAKKQLGELFGEDQSEWIKPLLDDDEIALFDEAKRQAEKARKNGKII